MPPLPAAAENFLQLLTHGPPALNLMSSLRLRNPLEMRDETREKQLPPQPQPQQQQNGTSNNTTTAGNGVTVTSFTTDSSKVDPFSNYVSMGRWDWIQLAIGTVFLLPIRALLLILTLLLAWLVAKIGLMGLSEEESSSAAAMKGRTGWRRKLMSAYAYFGYAVFLVSGFKVKVIGRQATRGEAPVLVGAPHSSFLEAVVMILCESSPVSRLESKNAILISTIQQFYQSLYVDRRTSSSRQEAKDLITARSLSKDDNLPQLFLCPEGTNTNRRALIQFKLGAFTPGVPVQPVAIRYPGHDAPRDDITWTFNQKHSYMFSLWLLLAKLGLNRVEIEYLDVYRPSPEERAHPELYAKNVQLALSKALNLPATDLTFTKYYNQYCAMHNLINNADGGDDSKQNGDIISNGNHNKKDC